MRSVWTRATQSNAKYKSAHVHLHDKIMLSCYFRLKFLLSHRNIHFDMDWFPYIDESALCDCVAIQETKAFVVQWQRMYALCVSNCSDELLSMSMRSAICVCTIRILAYFDFTSQLLYVCIISLGILSDSIIVGLRYVYLFFSRSFFY